VNQLDDNTIELEEEDDITIEHMSDDELITKLEDERNRSSTTQTELVSNRDTAYKYFRKELPVGPKDESKSSTVSGDVQNALLTTLAEVRQAFAKTQLVKVLPDKNKTKEEAETETNALNSILFDRNPGDVVIQNIIFDALLQRNCIVKVFIEDRKKVSYETIEGVNEFILEEVLQPTEEGQEVEVVEQMMEQESVISEWGEMMMPAIFSLRVKRITPKQTLRVESVPLDEIRINSDLNTIDLQEARFLCHTRPVSVSELLERGYDESTVMSLDTYTPYSDMDTVSRMNSDGITDFVTSDDSNELKEIHEAYYKIDYDGDKIAELRRVVYSGNEMFENDVVDFIPFSAGAAFLNPHQFEGTSLFDRLMEIQDIKTTFTRQMLDNSIRANRERVVADKRAGKEAIKALIRGSNLVIADNAGAIVPLPHENILPASVGLLDYMDRQRAQSGGGAIEAQTENKIVSGTSAHSTERLMSKMEISSDSITANLSSSVIRSMFLLIHKTLRTQWQGEIMSYEDDEPVMNEPSLWTDLESVRIKPNLSAGQKNQILASLDQVELTYEKLAATGMYGILFNANNVYRLMMDKASAAGVQMPSDYYIDPQSEEGMQALQAQQKQEEEKKNLEIQTLKLQLEQPDRLASIEGQYKELIEKMRTEKEMSKFAEELEFKYDQLRVQLLDVQKKHDIDSKNVELKDKEIKSKSNERTI
jgi:hypothetical protein